MNFSPSDVLQRRTSSPLGTGTHGDYDPEQMMDDRTRMKERVFVERSSRDVIFLGPALPLWSRHLQGRRDTGVRLAGGRRSEVQNSDVEDSLVCDKGSPTRVLLEAYLKFPKNVYTRKYRTIRKWRRPRRRNIVRGLHSIELTKR